MEEFFFRQRHFLQASDRSMSPQQRFLSQEVQENTLTSVFSRMAPQFSTAQNALQITSVVSPASSQLLVSWTSSSSAVATFLLDLRVVNNNTIAPIVSYVTGTTRSKLMQGLKAGTFYNVTLKSYNSSGKLLDTTWAQSQTLSVAPQMTTYDGISSTEIKVGWSSESGADYYFLMVTLGTSSINRTVYGLSCTVAGLQPSSLYNLNVYAINSGGPSAASKRVTALTLTQPPTNVSITPLSSYVLTLNWTSVEKALMYGIFIYEDGVIPQLAYIRKTTSLSMTLDNLLPCTKYIFGFTSYNWFYRAGEENRISFETGQMDSPKDLTIQYNSNLASAVVSWKPSLWASSYTAYAKSETGHEVLCTSNSTSCEIRGFLCEQRYNVRATAKMGSCTSNTSEPIILETAPCAPENVTVICDCQVNTVSIYWNPVVSAVKYNAFASAPDGSKMECSNKDTFCFFMDLLCGTEYELGVFAFNGKINGSSSPGINIRTAPCDPLNVQAYANCQDSSLQVSWDPSEGASSYLASAIGSSGATYNCSSTNPSCQIIGQCGESMSVSVIAYDNNCPSMESEPVEVVTAPCAPQNISALTNCEDNSTNIQWDFSAGAVLYQAHAVATDGSKYSCESFEQSCLLSGLPCSHTYNVSVTATNYQCLSHESPSVQFKTAPCIPKNINAELNCDHNTIQVSWADDPEDITFKATAKSHSGNYNCTSQDNFCDITYVACGENLTISVEASFGQCVSSSIQRTQLYSAPCKPENVSTKRICAERSLEISWTKSLGVGTDMYVAVLEDSNAQRLICESTEDHCIIQDIQCGGSYQASVSAVNSKCETRSGGLHVDPEPCSPMNLHSKIGASIVVLSWMGMPGALNYTTDITGIGEEKYVCKSSNTSCSVTQLQCGHQYDMMVTAAGRYCHSNVSGIHSFQTAPCAPENVTVHVDCVTNVATVLWETSLGAGNYTAVVVGTAGERHVCHSDATSCDISGLSCGQRYVASISATNGESTGESSSPVEFHTAPCIPVLETPQITCYNNSVSLSWSRAPGAIIYTANVTSPEAEALSCETDDTGCTINGLQCGHIYSVTVTGIDRQCSGPTTIPAPLTTGPCQPQKVIAQMDCLDSSAHLSWDVAPGAMSYLTSIKSASNDYVICNHTEVGCEIRSLPCGKTYDVMVTAVNSQCSSDPSFPVQLYTVPCVPSDVQPTIDCESNIASLTWADTSGAVNYTSVVTGPQGQTYECQSTNTSCSFSQLPCGLKFDVTVTAGGNSCHSDVSALTAFHTVPCQSGDVSVSYECGADSAFVSWMEAMGAITYKVSAVDGLKSDCVTTELYCALHDMQCGKTYNVTVESIGATCNSTAFFPAFFSTAPCETQNVTAAVDCHVEDKAVLSWSKTPGASNYTALVVGPDGEHTCHSMSTTCEVSVLHCGLSYNVTITPWNTKCQGVIGYTNFITAPCAVHLTQTETHCDVGSVTLYWSEMYGVDGFSSYLVGSDGVNKTCDSADVFNCTFPALECGHEYNAYVNAFNTKCEGPLSNSLKVNSVPCIPLDVKASVDCMDNSVLISWNNAPGALYYTSSLSNSQGGILNYTSSGPSYRAQDLLCGELYTAVVTAHNDFCSSRESSAITFKSVPCPPGNLNAHVAPGQVELSWSKASGALNYSTEVNGDNGDKLFCHSSNTSCVMTDLKCGHHYSMIVKANGEECTSNASHQYEFKTAPSTPENVLVHMDCVSNAASVSWNTSLGAENYTSVTIGANGENYVCNSKATSCAFSGLTCGTSYEVTVTATNQVSHSEASLPVQFKTAPCHPSLESYEFSCDDNSASLSWDSPSGALSYFTSLTSPGVVSLSCGTEMTDCVVPHLACGHIYNVTVTAADSQCLSPPSAQAMITTVPCQPQDLTVTMNCHNSSASLSWKEASGALWYESSIMDSGVEMFMCRSTGPTSEVSELPCGKNYTVEVRAFNDRCHSVPSSVAQLYTAPCIPTEPEVNIDCESNEATLSWMSSEGAVNYSVTVTGSNGDQHHCSTAHPPCTFSQLSCGLEYEASIVAVGEICSNDKSLTAKFHTAPCEARNLHSEFQCGSHHTILSWGAAAGGVNYNASVKTQDGESISCSTNDTQCTVENLQCGQIYTVSVEAFGVVCSSKAVSNEFIQTEPCVPRNVNVEIGCLLNNATVSWSDTLGSENFTAVASSKDGQKLTCQTTSTSCEITGLHCSLTYNISVTAFNKQCQGEGSHNIQLITAPCAVEQLQAVVNCTSNSLTVSWNQLAGADSFTSYLTSPNGANRTCYSLADCTFHNLPCGNEYTLTVSASNSQCDGPMSEVVRILTAPCVPVMVNKALDCVTNSALISWSESQGALDYTPILTGPNGENYNCSSEGTSCWVTGIPCGEDYNVAMMTQNEVCSSVENGITILKACSCAHQDISIFHSCNSDVVTLHWTEPPGAIHYKSAVVSSHGEIYTCETTNTTCDINNIQCGENYSVTVTAFNEKHANMSYDVESFLTAPCVATNVRAQLHCGTSVASLSWDPVRGADTYRALVNGQSGWSQTCDSNSTSCDISDLECGQVYGVTLTASNSQCNTANSTKDIYTAPCIPQNVRTSIICETNITEVSWDRTPGALNYTAIVQDGHGRQYSCSTSNTMCSIEALECGHTYRLIVTAYGEQCQTNSTVSEFHTGPCVPQTLEVTPLCAWDHLTLSWGASLGADYYIGTLVGQDGTTLTCNTTAQRCDISDVQCADIYNATVTAYNDQCRSKSSLPVLMSTAPCVPTNLTSSVSCDTQFVMVKWNDDLRPTPATGYIVTARNAYTETSYTTTRTSYTFTSLLCDEDYEITISSRWDSCNSHGNSSVHVKTIPCPPEIQSAYAECGNNSGIIQWNPSHNARSFLAAVSGVDSLSCNTSDTTCEIPTLRCGQNYTVTVWAEDGTCMGKPSTDMTFKTVPCIPQHVNATILCQKNAFSLSWDASPGATAYSAMAIGRQGQRVTADPEDPTCLMSGLQCGEVYNVTVLARHDECKSSETAALEITSVPCTPMNLAATADCDVTGATASWEPSAGAVSYKAVFSRPGENAECITSNTSCSVSGLQCGQDYNVTVTAFDNSCHGVTSDAKVVTTAPCKPTNVEASINCSSADLLNVTWTPSRGAESYEVTAKTDDGHTLSCQTTTSTCKIQGAQCGQLYHISVIAKNLICASDPTVSVEPIQTVPCTPNIVNVSTDCVTNEASVSWQENNTISAFYTALARHPSGKEQTCTGISTSCSISDLECGVEYSFHVFSSTHHCDSLLSAAYKYKTAPCQPKNVTTELQCDNNDAILSWTKSSGASYYIGTLTGNGSTLLCNTTDNRCTYRGLQCGQIYQASVIAMDEKCASLTSATSTFPTAPCQPQGFSIDLDCDSQIVSMLWRQSDGAQLYSVQMQNSSGTEKSYTTSNVSISSEVLACSQTYGFTVTAIGQTCNSSKSQILYEHSAPCVPVDVKYTTTCPSTKAKVEWAASEGSTNYYVTATEAGGGESSCSSTDTSCVLPSLDCGVSYDVQVVAAGQKCRSDASLSVALETAPCLPKNIDVYMNCKNNSAVLSWEQSRGAQQYRGVVKSNENVVYTCETAETGCIVPDLSCGAVYNFSVLAIDGQCNSSFTEPTLSGMVPCPPDEVSALVYHGSVMTQAQEVETFWNGSHCGSEYMATVQGQIGYDPESLFTLSSYWTSYMDFYIPVPCSSSYHITITARNTAGPSSPSSALQGYTAPCPPQVDPVEIKEGTILITWKESAYANQYIVVEMDHGNIICTTPGLACETSSSFSSFQVFAVNSSGKSSPTVIQGHV